MVEDLAKAKKLQQQQDLLQRIQSGSLRVPDGGAKVRAKIAELEKELAKSQGSGRTAGQVDVLQGQFAGLHLRAASRSSTPQPAYEATESCMRDCVQGSSSIKPGNPLEDAPSQDVTAMALDRPSAVLLQTGNGGGRMGSDAVAVDTEATTGYEGGLQLGISVVQGAKGPRWLSSGVLGPVGGKLSREAVLETRDQLLTQPAPPADPARGLGSEAMVEDSQVPQSMELEHAGSSGSHKRAQLGRHVGPEARPMRRTQLLGAEVAARLEQQQARQVQDARERLLKSKPPLHRSLLTRSTSNQLEEDEIDSFDEDSANETWSDDDTADEDPRCS